MSVLYLDVEMRRIQKMLRESWPERMDAQAAETARAAEAERYRASYAKRHTPENDSAA